MTDEEGVEEPIAATVALENGGTLVHIETVSYSAPRITVAEATGAPAEDGGVADAGASNDAGASLDAGANVDAGVSTDAGTTPPGTPANDAGIIASPPVMGGKSDGGCSATGGATPGGLGLLFSIGAALLFARRRRA